MRTWCWPVVPWLVLAAPAAPAGWLCTGEDLPQISCGADSCQAETELTPVSSSYDSAGRLSACYYTGCHEGPVTSMLSDGGVLTLIARGAAWIHEDSSTETVALSIRTDEGIGVLLAAGFFTPLRCHPWRGLAKEDTP